MQLARAFEAREACEDVWRVPAGTRSLNYIDEGDTLMVEGNGAASTIHGWSRVKGGLRLFDWRSPALPVLWTPQIKALWAPVKLPSSRSVDLDVHVLGLSFGAFAEADPMVHTLLRHTADAAAARFWREAGSPSALAARAL